MLNLSYARSPKLNVLLEEIDRNRVKILSAAISREVENKLAWRAKLARTYYSLSLSGNSLKRRRMARLLSTLTPLSKQRLTKQEQEVIYYNKAQSHINESWYMNENLVVSRDVYKLYKLSSEPIFGNSKTSFKQKQKQLAQLLEYISKGEDHPVIQAGVVQMQLRLISPFKTANGRATRLLSQLYLYKSDYDMRGMLVLDGYWKRNLNRYKQEVAIAEKSDNMTGWLEYFAEAVSEQTTKALRTIRTDRKVVGVSKVFWQLNLRQKQIMSSLENPEMSIRNDDIQNTYGVSQITASRDLAKLYKLGLVLRQGKGRSVFYTRI